MDVSTPRRRCVAATPTMVTPAAGTAAPPGTVSRNRNALAVPTHTSPSQAPIERSTSVSSRHSVRSSADSGTPPKARSRLSYHSSQRSGTSTRKSVPMRHAYQGTPGAGEGVSAALGSR